MLRQYTVGCNYFDAKFSNVLWFGLLNFYLLKISQHMCVLIEKKPQTTSGHALSIHYSNLNLCTWCSWNLSSFDNLDEEFVVWVFQGKYQMFIFRVIIWSACELILQNCCFSIFSLTSPVQKNLFSRENKDSIPLGCSHVRASSLEERAQWLSFGKMADERLCIWFFFLVSCNLSSKL